VFALSYADMPGIDINFVVHKVPFKERTTHVKQKLRRTHSYMMLKVKDKIARQWDACFLEVVRYP